MWMESEAVYRVWRDREHPVLQGLLPHLVLRAGLPMVSQNEKKSLTLTQFIKFHHACMHSAQWPVGGRHARPEKIN